MRVLFSLGNRSRDNTDSDNEHCDLVVSTTNVESSERDQRRAQLHRAETGDIAVAESTELTKETSTDISSERTLERLEQEKDSCNTLLALVTNSSRSIGHPQLHQSSASIKAERHKSGQDSLVTLSARVLQAKPKRVRIDITSETKNQFAAASRRKMAVGGRFKSDSDDESTFAAATHQHPPRRFWVEPAENEPPFVIHNNPALITASHDVDSDDHDCSQRSASETAHVGVSATASDESAEELSVAQFISSLKKRGFEMVEQDGDGNCLFRAVSLQVYGSPDNHSEVRERCMDYMAQNEEHFSNFIATSSIDELIIPLGKESMTAFQLYIERKRMKGVHGNHTEIQALSELFNRPVEVYTPEAQYIENENLLLQPMNIFHEEYKTADPPIRLSYHDGNHYNAIIDPLIPTAGLGLGLPGLKVGLADKMQITKAITESDQLADQLELERVLKESQDDVHNNTEDELQQVLKESTRDFMYEQKMIALSDFEETNFAIEQKVLASSMETYFRQEHGRKQRATVPSVGSSSRRRRCSPAPLEEASSQANLNSVSAVAVTAAAQPPAAASSSSSSRDTSSITTTHSVIDHSVLDEEYPQVVQELVMNGFELQDVIRAFEFVGDRFDDLLSFLLSSSKTS